MFLLKHTEVTTVSLSAFLRALHKEPQWPAPIMQQKLGGSSPCAGLIFHSQQCSCLWGGTAVPAACPALWCHVSKQEGKMQLLLWEYSQDFGAKNAALQCQEPCQDLKKLMVRCCAIALDFFPGISRKLLPVIFPFVTVRVQAQLWIYTYWKADTSLNATGLL